MTFDSRRSVLLASGMCCLMVSVASVAMAEAPQEELVRYQAIHMNHRADILKMPGVTGTAVGTSAKDPGKLVIIVYVQKGADERSRRSLPSDLDGAPVEVIELGAVNAAR